MESKFDEIIEECIEFGKASSKFNIALNKMGVECEGCGDVFHKTGFHISDEQDSIIVFGYCSTCKGNVGRIIKRGGKQ